TSMPLLHPRRRELLSGRAEDFQDDLLLLHRFGIGAMVSLLTLPDLEAPSISQFHEFLKFMKRQRLLGNKVAVHCVAGRGRTGTVLAGYLIAEGATVNSAIARVRRLQPGAIETPAQEEFLHRLEP